MASRSFWVSLFLLLPAALILFLQFFGKSEFALPIYYEHEMGAPPSVCKEIKYGLPYRIPTDSQLPLKGNSVLLFADDIEVSLGSKALHGLSRVRSRLGQKDVTWIAVQSISSPSPFRWLSVEQLDPATFEKEKKCYYLMGNYPVALVDGERRIRGYYTLHSLKERERLEVEIAVLLQEQ